MNLTEEDLKLIESHVQNLHEGVELNDETLIDITKGIANYRDKLKYLNIPIVSGSYIAFCDGADEGIEGLVQLSNKFDNELAGKRYCKSFKSKSPVLYKLVE